MKNVLAELTFTTQKLIKATPSKYIFANVFVLKLIKTRLLEKYLFSDKSDPIVKFGKIQPCLQKINYSSVIEKL